MALGGGDFTVVVLSLVLEVLLSLVDWVIIGSLCAAATPQRQAISMAQTNLVGIFLAPNVNNIFVMYKNA
jgi:hypothetical protein